MSNRAIPEVCSAIIDITRAVIAEEVAQREACCEVEDVPIASRGYLDEKGIKTASLDARQYCANTMYKHGM